MPSLRARRWGVFNSLVMFDQHVKQNSIKSVVPDLATGWSWSEDGTELAPDAEQGRHVMTQAYCERCDFPVPMRWLYAGSDLSRPDRGDQCAERPLMRSRALAEMPIAGSSPRLSHTSRSLPGSVAPTIKVGADIKSP
jgi:hypothetical protein